MSQFGFSLTEELDAVQLDITSDQLASISVDSIAEDFYNSKFSNFKLNLELLNELFNNPANSETEAPPLPDTSSLVIAIRQDASLEITTTEDHMIATAKITCAYGGGKIKAKQILISASKQGINHGLIMSNITTLAKNSHKAEPGSVIEKVIARGTPAVDGIDGYLEKIAATLKDRVLRPQKKKDGTVDMHNLGAIASCQIGDILMRRHPPIAGEYGSDVKGQAIAFTAGADPRLFVGEGTKISPEDSNLLIANRKGLPRHVDNGMTIDDVLELKRVDLSTGNIKFDGSILIEQNVSEDMQVEAHGDIRIGGIVESATIQAEGDIFIGKGIIGRQLSDNRAEHSIKVSAKGDLHAKYAQNADLTSGKTIVMKEYLFNSTSRATDSIWVGRDDKADGHLMGGSAWAGKLITAGFIGAESGSSASFDLSSLILKIQDEVLELESECQKHQATITRLGDTLRSLLQATPKKTSAIDRANLMLSERQEMLNEFELKLKDKRAEKEACLSQASLVAEQKLYSLIQVKILGQQLTTKREHGPVRVITREGELKIEPLY